MSVTLSDYQLQTPIHQGAKTIIYKAWRVSDASRAIVKTLIDDYPTIDDITRLRHEHKILERLNIEGIIKAYSLEKYKNGLALILEDFGGNSLKKMIQGQAIPVLSFLGLAIQLVEAIAQLHKQSIIHKDIKPDNIVFNPATGQIKLIDLSIASLLQRENPSLSHLDLLEGTLAYMSPEQTGRMNRTLDYRTDFYSLGVTFYEMLTGQLPFNANDPLEWVHSHIAKFPTSPHLINPQIPEAISAIVMKLLAKMAEQRYQSAEGLKADLETCLIQLQNTGRISNFIPGTIDQAGQLLIPQKLYGRDSEAAKLLETFDRVANSSTELMLVSGYSGIGKTVLVHEVHKPIVRQRGYFIAGKFDQFKRNIPYASLIQAFQSLILQLLTESEQKIKTWKKNLLEALGKNGKIITDVIPEVELIIGKQPPVTQLGVVESQHRFHRVFQQFIRVFAAKDHPLVVFLDDLQWADSASLNLLELLITDVNSHYLFLIGAYRDNEVSKTHPLILAIEKIQTAGATVNQIVLEPLKQQDVQNLIADTLNEGELMSQQTEELASLLFHKTGGNPFFLTQLIKTLYAENVLGYALESGRWQWNAQQLQAIAITDDTVVELVARNLRKLPLETQQVLKLAACIGNTFNLEVLAVVNQNSALVTATQLWPALQAGLILPLSHDYKIPLVFAQEETSSIALTDVKVDYKFLHDRVQQAAYSLIPNEEKEQTHLKIGQLLLSQSNSQEREENIFALINQLNYGLELITSEAEKIELAELNLIAGQKALAATAYESALKYLQVGLNLLTQESWQRHYELALALHEKASEAALLSGNFEQMESLVEVILRESKTLLDKVRAYEIRIKSCESQWKPKEAVELGLQVLELLGVSLNSWPSEAEIGAALTETAQYLADKTNQDLLALPAMTNPIPLAVLRVIATLVPSAFFSAPPLFPLLVCEQVNVSVKHGNAIFSASGFADYSIILSAVLQNISAGSQFGQLALDLVEHLNAQGVKSQTLFKVASFTWHWTHSLRESVPLLEQAYTSGLENGDLAHASYSAAFKCQYTYWCGCELSRLAEEMENYEKAIAQINQEIPLKLHQIFHQLVLNLIGQSEESCRLVGSVYDEEKYLPQHHAAKERGSIHYVFLAKLILCYLFGESEQAVQNATEAQQYLDGVIGWMAVPVFHFYDSLARLAIVATSSPSEQAELLKKVEDNQTKMQNWATHAPMNFLAKYELVEAEKARVLGNKIEAIDHYDRAIALSKENDYLQEEAIAYELAAKFYLAWGKDLIAQTYLINAYYAYARWGATAKVQALESHYPDLLLPILEAKNHQKRGESLDQTHATTTLTSFAGTNFLDLATVIKASQAISNEIVLAELLTKLMQILLENAGAERGVFLIAKNQNFFIEAIATQDTLSITPSLALEAATQQTPPIPVSPAIIHYVARTQTNVVLNDATQEELFSSDTYVTQWQPKSVLCTPILYQGKLTGIVYLENNLTVGAFTPKRVEILQLLSAQSAIALENAQLYANLAESNRTLEAKVEERTQALHEKNAHLELEIQERQKAEQAAQTANIAKSRFLANMSHELRTPLNGILGYAQILQRDKNLSDRQRNGVTIIQECGQHLLTLINDALDLSKIEAGKMELNPKALHFPHFLQSLAEICRLRAEQKGISLIYHASPSLPTYIEADEKKLRQVLLNLLSNAVKFTDAGGVTFKVEILNEKPIAANTLSLHFEVKDTGIGISPQELSKIFLPFEQVGDSSHQTEGTGLGLAISHQLVEMMGGKIKVKSSTNQGSIFWFDLNLAIAHKPITSFSKSAKTITGFVGPVRKILVVDDKWENRSVLLNLLTPLGFEILEAKDGQDCLHKAIEFQPDCIFTDLVMPVMDGFEATRQLRKLPDFQNIPIIATSASILSQEKQGSFEAGCNGFLAKPIRSEELFHCLHEFLSLEWIYEDLDATPPNPRTQPLETIEKQTQISLPEQDLAVFWDLAKRGDLGEIQKQAERLKNDHPQYHPFASRLSELAKDFDEQQILELLQQETKQ